MAAQRIYTQNATLVKLCVAILRSAWHITLLVQVSFLIMQNDRKKDYESKRDTKRVSFNTEKDADIIAYIKDKEFSTYVKKLIREDMKK